MTNYCHASLHVYYNSSRFSLTIYMYQFCLLPTGLQNPINNESINIQFWILVYKWIHFTDFIVCDIVKTEARGLSRNTSVLYINFDSLVCTKSYCHLIKLHKYSFYCMVTFLGNFSFNFTAFFSVCFGKQTLPKVIRKIVSN